MKANSDIAAIILNYNGFEHTRECLESLQKSTCKLHSIIVVDGGSTDDSVRKLKQNLYGAELIELTVNGGYSYGNNIGIDHAFRKGAQYVFIINNDIIVDQNCVENLERAVANDKTIGIIGPKVLYYSKPDTINYAGMTGCIHKASYKRIGLDEKDNGQYKDLVDTLYQDGCAILLSRLCYEKVGAFDEGLWAYSEESDLCMRARSNGFRVCCLQKARVWHKVSATLGTHYFRRPHAIYYAIRNSFIFHRRHAAPGLKRALAVLILLSRTPRHMVKIVFKSRGRKITNVWMLITATLVGVTTNSRRPSDIFAPIKTVRTNNNL